MPDVGEWQGIKINATWSFQDFEDKLLIDVPIEEFPSELPIVGSNFSQQIMETSVFPKGVSGLQFINCNLDNVILPEGCKLCADSCNQQHKIGNDGKDYVIQITTDAKDSEKKIYTEVAIIGTAEAVAEWETKRTDVLDIVALKEAQEVSEEVVGEVIKWR